MMHSEFLARFARWVIAQRLWVIAATVAITLAAAFAASRLAVVIDPAELLPQTHPFVSSKKLLEGVFGEKDQLLITLTPSDGAITSPQMADKVKRLTVALRQMKGVLKPTLLSYASPNAKAILANADGFEIRPFSAAVGQPGTFADWLRRNPAYQGTMVSSDGRSVLVLAQFEPDAQGFDAVLKRVEPLIDRERDASTTIRLSGNVNFLAQTERYSARMVFLLPLAIILIGLLHFEAFRSVQGMVLPLVTAILSLVWVLGVMGASGIRLDVFNVTTPILILAVAAGHAVQILKRYYEEYDRLRAADGMSPAEANCEAVVATISRVGRFMILASMIAALGFLSLVIFEIKTVQTFGIFSALGIVSALIIELTFIPALRSWMKPPSYPARNGASPDIWGALIERIVKMALSARLVVPVLGLVVLAVAGAFQVNIDNSNKANFAEWTDVRRDDTFINTHFAGTQAFYVMIDSGQPDGIKDPRLLAGIEALQLALGQQAGVGKTLSIVDHLRRMHHAMHGDAAEANVLPGSRELAAQYLLLYSMAGNPEDLDSFIDQEHRRANIKVYIKPDDTAFVQKLVNIAQATAATAFPPGVALSFGGGAAADAALNEVLARDKLLNIAQICAVVFVLSSILFRSLIAGLLVLLPLLMAVLANFGVLGWLGIPLNIPTSLISAMAVGIGADYAIYLLSRYREEARSHAPEDALRRTLATSGKACLYVATAVAGGYGVLALSFGFKAHQWLSMLIVLSMLTSALASLILIPAFVHRFRPGFIFENGPSSTS